MICIFEGADIEGDTERGTRAKESFHLLGVLERAEKHETKVKLLVGQVNKKEKKTDLFLSFRCSTNIRGGRLATKVFCSLRWSDLLSMENKIK